MKKHDPGIVISKLKAKLTNKDPEATWSLKTSVVFILVLGATAFASQFSGSSIEAKAQPPQPFSWDMVIPESESLVPIRVANYESLDQVIGQYGVVDLLSTPLNPKEKPKRVAYAVKLIRSKESRRHFSVLVPGDEAHQLVGYHGEFTVVVRNPKLLGTKIVKKKSKKKHRPIVYEME